MADPPRSEPSGQRSNISNRVTPPFTRASVIGRGLPLQQQSATDGAQSGATHHRTLDEQSNRSQQAIGEDDSTLPHSSGAASVAPNATTTSDNAVALGGLSQLDNTIAVSDRLSRSSSATGMLAAAARRVVTNVLRPGPAATPTAGGDDALEPHPGAAASPRPSSIGALQSPHARVGSGGAAAQPGGATSPTPPPPSLPQLPPPAINPHPLPPPAALQPAPRFSPPQATAGVAAELQHAAAATQRISRCRKTGRHSKSGPASRTRTRPKLSRYSKPSPSCSSAALVKKTSASSRRTRRSKQPSAHFSARASRSLASTAIRGRRSPTSSCR